MLGIIFYSRWLSSASFFKPLRVVTVEHFPPPAVVPVYRLLFEPTLCAPGFWVPFNCVLLFDAASVLAIVQFPVLVIWTSLW